MKLLAIETTGPIAGVALIDKTEKVGVKTSDSRFNHLKDLVPMINDLIQEEGLSMDDLTHIAVSAGPGSFTGIRIGVSTARALGQTLEIPLIQVPTLETFLYIDEEFKGIVIPEFDARRKQIYSGAYVLDKSSGKIEILVEGGPYYREDFEKKLEESIAQMGDKNSQPEIRRYGEEQSALAVASWALSNIRTAKEYNFIEPIYMREAEAKRKFEQKKFIDSINTRQARPEDALAMYELEKESFSHPWRLEEFISDLSSNEAANYLLAEKDGQILAYAGLWSVIDEGHIVSVAVRKGYRKQGLGTLLMRQLLKQDPALKAFTLEVKETNLPAIRMYESLGFKYAGKRKKYYKSGEDAVIMWKR